MGSENNMVAVPVECTDEIAEAIAMEANVCGGIAETIWRKAVAAARLASSQPDAQQGEGWRIAAWNACRKRGLSDEASIGLVQAIADELAATPPSPALDAATIERCAQVALEDRTPAYGPHRADMESLAETQRNSIAARIRALPNAEKRHG